MRNMTENLHKLILDKFGEKNALFVGQDVRANTIALRHKDSVKSLETAIYRIRIFSEDSCHTLRTYSTYDGSDTTAPQLGQNMFSRTTMCRNFRIVSANRTISTRAMSCGSRHVRLRGWRAPLVLLTCVEWLSCLAMPIEGMRSRYILCTTDN